MNDNSQQNSFFSPSLGGNIVQKQNQQTPRPITTKTQQKANNFINDTRDTDTFTNPLTPSNIVSRNQSSMLDGIKINSTALQGTTPLSYEMNMRSVKDLEQRMTEISKYNLGNIISDKQQATSNNITNNQVTNNSSNTTVIATDYVRNMRSDYQSMPMWRSYSG